MTAVMSCDPSEVSLWCTTPVPCEVNELFDRDSHYAGKELMPETPPLTSRSPEEDKNSLTQATISR